MRRGGDLSSERRRPPGMPSTSTSLTRTTGRPRKKCIEYSPHLEQQHGLLVVDKPRGLSSAQCTNRFKRVGQKKIGHAGTLDPMAQGVLLVLLGHATKISGYLMAGGVKAYQGTVRLGQTTDTWDADGQITAEAPWDHVTAEAVADVIAVTGTVILFTLQFRKALRKLESENKT